MRVCRNGSKREGGNSCSANGKYQLEGSYDQRISVRPTLLENKAFKYYIRKEKAMALTHLERGKSC